MNDTVYITGHKNPDTDSIVASIAYAYLKNQKGQRAVACRLGPLNQETSYVLNRFGFDEPLLLEDARVRVGEIEYAKPLYVGADCTIFNALKIMYTNGKPFLAVIDHEYRVIGMVTKNDLSMVGLGDTAFGIDLLKQTPVENVVNTLEGALIYKAKNPHANGKVSIVALSDRRTKYYDVKDRIVVIGEDVEAQKDLIKKGAAMLIMVWTDTIDEEVVTLAKEYDCSLVISGLGVMNTSRYIYFSPAVSLLMSTNVDMFYEYEYMEDLVRKLTKTQHKSYPIIDRDKHFLGFLYKEHAINYPRKKMILVDHNEFSQSVNHIRHADVVEVVDHHRIYDFFSRKPIRFRNEIVGSTSTIITSMYMEANVAIPKNIAGILLCAIISDTLNFQSPTTTTKDIELAEELAKIANVDMEQLAYDMFYIGSDIENKTMKDFLKEDVKDFEVGGYRVMVAQVIVPNVEALNKFKNEIQPSLDEYAQRYGYDLSVLAFTSIMDKGSLFFYSGKISNWFKEDYSYDEKGIFMKDVLSRKKQIIPLINDIISQNV
ncbi:MAG: putative manganese-dependent inorganic diphosphatase [Holdemanella sp.]|nr:putative manganese-dependent inorganic diphosphatase [Holdemanella sp.]